MAFTKATKHQAKLRLAVFGPSGSGKTFSGLRIATGLGGKIAVIDTERGSASKYADRFEFDVCELQDRTIEGYCVAIREAAGAGYGVLIIDSLSHAWQELLGEVDRLAKTKFRGNTWSAWSEGTPKQRLLVDALMQSPMHVIATMRSKTEWAQESDDRGKIKPVKVGLAPEQGKGIEYEFDMLLELTTEHFATVSKDRTGKFQDKTLEKPGEDFGKEMAAWLASGAAVVQPQKASADRVARLISLCIAKRIPDATQAKWRAKANADNYEQFAADAVEKLIAYCEAQPEPRNDTGAAYEAFISQCESAAIDSGLEPGELAASMQKWFEKNNSDPAKLASDIPNQAVILKLIKNGRGYFSPAKPKVLEGAAA